MYAIMHVHASQKLYLLNLCILQYFSYTYSLPIQHDEQLVINNTKKYLLDN